MRVLTLSWEYPPNLIGGLGAHVTALVPALARQGLDVHVVTPNRNGGPAEEVIPYEKDGSQVVVHRVECPPTASGNLYTEVQQTNLCLAEAGTRISGELGFDLLHAHDWLVAFAAASLRRLQGCPLVATVHATERGRMRGNLVAEMSHAINGAEWSLTHEATRVITTSRSMAQEVEGYFDIAPAKIAVVPNGVDTDMVDALEFVDLTEFRTLWAAPDSPIVFFVGRLTHEKGAHLILEAAPRVLSEFPHAQFVIAGTGAMAPTLAARAHELGIADQVRLPGFIPDETRDRLFKVAQVAVFPSLYEPFGIVTLEAMAAKCPVVVSEVGGLKEVVTCYENGLTVYPDNIESLSWGIQNTLRRPDWARQRAETAYETVRRDYSWDRVAARTVTVYREALDAKR